jgi:hypothetical protein
MPRPGYCLGPQPYVAGEPQPYVGHGVGMGVVGGGVMTSSESVAPRLDVVNADIVAGGFCLLGAGDGVGTGVGCGGFEFSGLAMCAVSS